MAAHSPREQLLSLPRTLPEQLCRKWSPQGNPSCCFSLYLRPVLGSDIVASKDKGLGDQAYCL